MKRRVVLLAGLFGVLLGLVLLVPPSQQRLPPLTVYSAEPGGGKALRLWLEELGYKVTTLESTSYRVPANTTTLLILQPTGPFNKAELDELERWVRSGGRLVLAGDGVWTGELLHRFQVGLRALRSEIEIVEPIAGAPLDGLITQVTVRADEELLPPAAAVPLLGDAEHVVGAFVSYDQGQVWAVSAADALTNELLGMEGNARLALSLVGPLERGGIVIDELHHGYGLHPPRPLLALLLDRAWGQAALVGALVTFCYLLLRGRRFGRSRPLEARPGRSASEYVSSLAALYRAGGKRAFIARHFGERLRREYCQALGLAGDSSDDRVQARARAMGRDPDSALAVLAALERRMPPAEAELLRLVRDGERERAGLARTES